jgi:hypothetical protein
MKFFGFFLYGLLTILLSSHAHAGFAFNPNLDKSDRKLIIETLGLGILTKNLSQPRSLGTDSGLEIGIITEIINTRRIKPLLTDSRNSDVLYYPKLIIGKGLYDCVDLFFHFIPFTSTLGVSEFGGMLRYNFIQSPDSLFVASALLHANSANFNNQLITGNFGADFSFGLAWENYSISTGLGWGKTNGTFSGGTAGVTDSLNEESESAQSRHISVGATVKKDIYTFALSVDHYREIVYAIKLGLLF